MKKLIPISFVVLIFAVLYGCSDSSTESKSSTITQTNISVANDSLYIFFNISGTTYDFSQKDSNLVFTGLPEINCDVKMTAGVADIWLYNSDSSNVWGRHYTAHSSDSLIMTFIPNKYKFSLSGFTGTGTIKARKP
jgi:hypothetical protein